MYKVAKSLSSMTNFTATALLKLPKDFPDRIVILLELELAQTSFPSANSSSTTHVACFENFTEGIKPSKLRKLNMAGL